jgi:hypothetical protein
MFIDGMHEQYTNVFRSTSFFTRLIHEPSGAQPRTRIHRNQLAASVIGRLMCRCGCADGCRLFLAWRSEE